jgi:hypothetical protein
LLLIEVELFLRRSCLNANAHFVPDDVLVPIFNGNGRGMVDLVL